MLAIEKEIVKTLKELKSTFSVKLVKIEFESEGASFNDVLRLRRYTQEAGIGLKLKISGPNAVRDIIDGIILGVDEIIAPMIESSFAVRSFAEAISAVCPDDRLILGINVESDQAVKNIPDIIQAVKEHNVSNIVLGRTDLVRSYKRKDLFQNDEFITKKIIEVGREAKKEGIKFGFGGRIDIPTYNVLERNQEILDICDYIETRNVVFDTKEFYASKEALTLALNFEKLLLSSKDYFAKLKIGPISKRIEELTVRAYEE